VFVRRGRGVVGGAVNVVVFFLDQDPLVLAGDLFPAVEVVGVAGDGGLLEVVMRGGRGGAPFERVAAPGVCGGELAALERMQEVGRDQQHAAAHRISAHGGGGVVAE